jgi:hypothetical protein
MIRLSWLVVASRIQKEKEIFTVMSGVALMV